MLQVLCVTFLHICFCRLTSEEAERRELESRESEGQSEAGRKKERVVTATVNGVKNHTIERKRDCSPESEVSDSA